MFECLICNIFLKTKTLLGIHIKNNHQLSLEQYYNKFFGNKVYCINCGKTTKFINITNGYTKFCSKKCSANSSDTKKKRNNTNLDRYGYTIPIHNKEILKKRKETFLNKYGVDNPLKNKEIRDKCKKTILKKYGVENPSQCKEVQEKRKETCLEKYGVKCNLQSVDGKQQKKSTWLKNYGVINPSQSNIIKIKKRDTFLKTFLPKVISLLKIFNLELLSGYKSNITFITVQCLQCNNIFNTTYFNLAQGCGRCPKCYPPINTSIGEKEIVCFIKNLGLEISNNDRSIIPPYELDIYIPSKSIAIEYNGLYWHSEKFRKKNHHLNKLNLCLDKNIKLIQIFEDEWILRRSIVEARLSHLLGYKFDRIHARCCTVNEIHTKVKTKFLENNHLQGTDNSIIKLGLFHKENLIAVMTFSHGSLAKGVRKISDDVWELSRFCVLSSKHVPGAASKLLAYFKKNYKWKKIFSYADKRWSWGQLYYQLGFKLKGSSKPNYWYVKGVRRMHRFAFRKKREEPKNIPEWFLRLQEGYSRIWDCGHLKFELDNK